MTDPDLLQWSLARLLAEYPHAHDFFTACGLSAMDREQKVAELLDALPLERLASLGLDRTLVVDRFLAFMGQMQRIQANQGGTIRRITVIGGPR